MNVAIEMVEKMNEIVEEITYNEWIKLVTEVLNDSKR